MGKAIDVRKMISMVNAEYEKRGKSHPDYTDISLMVRMAKSLNVSPNQFIDFVGLLADGKTFLDARDILVQED